MRRWCDNNSHKRELVCNKLSENECFVDDCCGFLNNKKCVAGNANGPLFRANSDGDRIDVIRWEYHKPHSALREHFSFSDPAFSL